MEYSRETDYKIVSRQNGVPRTKPRPPNGSLISPLDLETLTRSSDLIATGRVISVEDRGRTFRNIEGRTIDVERMVARLKITTLIKGRADGGLVPFEFVMPDQSPAYQNIEQLQFAMFFSEQPVQITPRLRYRSNDQSNTIDLAALTLGPNVVRELDLSAVIGKSSRA